MLNFAIYRRDPVLVQAALARGAGTGQLEKLFTTGAYYQPGFSGTRPFGEPACGSGG